MMPQIHPSSQKLTIQHPCPMRIADLEKNGFHCGMCNKTLVDFRGKPREEILATLSANPGKVCGIYSTRDVKPGSQSCPAIRGRLKRFIVALATIFLPLLPMQAGISTPQANIAVDTKWRIMPEGPRIAGIVKDGNGIEVSRADVTFVYGDQVIAYAKTDGNGYFEVELPHKDYGTDQIAISFDKKEIFLGEYFITNPNEEVCRKFTVLNYSEEKKARKKLENQFRKQEYHIVGLEG